MILLRAKKEFINKFIVYLSNKTKMNRLELEEKWNKIKGALKQKYAKWFEGDSSFTESELEVYIAKIQEKTGRTREDIEREIKDWIENENHL